MKGVFDVFDAMLSMSFSFRVGAIDDVDAEALDGYLGSYGFIMQAAVKSGGSVAVLFPVEDISGIISLLMGETEAAKRETLSDSDLATVKEVAEPCLGSGVTNLMERFRRNVEQPENVKVGLSSQESAPELAKFLGGSFSSAAFTFSAVPDFDSSGVMLFSQNMASLIPPDVLAKAGEERPAQDLAMSAEISDAEMADILGGFSPQSSPEEAAPTARAVSGPPPGNIERVLDIRLTVTARLGRVEMPVGDILSLGPGSIIDVGKLVDEPVELLVNEKLIARGDVVVVDEKFGLRITEIVSQQERIESMH